MSENPKENRSANDTGKSERKGAPEKKRFSIEKLGGFIKRYGTSVYMLTAFCLVAAVTFSVLALNMNYSDINDEIDIPDIVIPTLQNSVVTLPADKSVDSVQNGIDGKVGDATKPAKATEATNPASKYVFPVPSGNIVKKYSTDALVFSSTLGDYRIHSGIDIAGAIGAPVIAYTDGTISAVEDTPMMGKAVTVTHRYGLASVYMNLDTELPAGIKAGATVEAGTMIGKIGKTAIAEIGEEPHLHFEMTLNGTVIDPEKELENIK